MSARRLALLVAAITALAPFAIDAYLPAMPQIAAHIGESVHHTSVSVSVFLAGFAIGQLVFGPMSDRLGRRPVLIGGLILFIVSCLALMLTQSLSGLFFWRFVQALGGGACVVNSPAIVRDQFAGPEAAKVLSTMVMILLLAPLVAPMLGTALLYVWGWQLIFGFLMCYAIVVLAIVVFVLPETRTKPEHKPSVLAIAGHYKEVVTHRAALGYMMTCALSVAAMFAFITSSPYLYMEYYQVSPAVYPLLFGANIIVMAGSNRLNIKLLQHHRPRRLLKVGLSIQLIAALLMVAFVALRLDSVPVIMVLVMVFVGTAGLINPNAVSAMLDYFPHMSATANAVMGCLQFSLGAVAGAIISSLSVEGAAPMVVTMLICSVLANLLVRWLSERRMKSASV